MVNFKIQKKKDREKAHKCRTCPFFPIDKTLIRPFEFKDLSASKDHLLCVPHVVVSNCSDHFG